MALTDYYAVLGIDSHATRDQIRAAYRKLALRCHPDRGGCHEDMVRLNEAWDILSDPVKRDLYDQVCAQQQVSEADAAAWQETQQAASQRAAEYPKTWAAFSALLRSFSSDMAEAEYGSRVEEFGWKWPTASGISGKVFIMAGAMLGFLPVLFAVASLSLYEDVNRDPRLLLGIIGIAAALAWCGAWGGQLLHRQCQSWIHRHREQIVVVCDRCGQALQVPKLSSNVKATCPICGNEGTVDPAGSWCSSRPAGPSNACPQCGFSYKWDGVHCGHCRKV